MLTLGQQVIIEAFAKDFIKILQNVIKTKPIKRISRRKEKGKYVDRPFTSPVNASGNLANTLRYELTATHLSIWANDYIYELVWGKPPSLSASEIDHNLEASIRKWIDDKELSAVPIIDDDTLAYLMTRKIQKFGSSIYLAHHGQNSGLLENIINEQMIKSYNLKFTEQLKEDFIKAFKDGK